MPIKWLLLLLLLVPLLHGCGSGTKEKSKEEDDEPVTHQINVEGGIESTEYSEGDNPLRLWTIRGETAVLDVVGEDELYGNLDDVTGTLYTEGQPASTFSGKEGFGHREKKELELTGNVKVVSSNPPGTLYCDKLHWQASDEIIVATGNVRFEGAEYVMTTSEQLWATPDLRVIGSPEMFKQLVNQKTEATTP